MKQVLLLPGSDISSETCPARKPQLPDISLTMPPHPDMLPGTDIIESMPYIDTSIHLKTLPQGTIDLHFEKV